MKNWHEEQKEKRTFGAKVADFVAKTVGSWPFIITQSCLLALWIVLNVVAWMNHWDPYPFILLNLALSFQAAYTGPIVMMSQNRQEARDKVHAEHEYEHQEKELALNTSLTKDIHQLTKEIHETIKSGAAGAGAS